MRHKVSRSQAPGSTFLASSKQICMQEREVADTAQALAAHWEEEALRQGARAQTASALQNQASGLH